MAAEAHSLSSLDLDGDLDVAPLDDLDHLPLEVRAAIERAEANLRAGTARLVPHAEMDAALDEIRRRRMR